mgnify:CR=1 FL=1
MKSKRKIAVGDSLIFHTGNYAGLTGVVLDVNWSSIDERAIFGFLHTVKLSNNRVGFIEKSEHWRFT